MQKVNEPRVFYMSRSGIMKFLVAAAQLVCKHKDKQYNDLKISQLGSIQVGP